MVAVFDVSKEDLDEVDEGVVVAVGAHRKCRYGCDGFVAINKPRDRRNIGAIVADVEVEGGVAGEECCGDVGSQNVRGDKLVVCTMRNLDGSKPIDGVVEEYKAFVIGHEIDPTDERRFDVALTGFEALRGRQRVTRTARGLAVDANWSRCVSHVLVEDDGDGAQVVHDDLQRSTNLRVERRVARTDFLARKLAGFFARDFPGLNTRADDIDDLCARRYVEENKGRNVAGRIISREAVPHLVLEHRRNRRADLRKGQTPGAAPRKRFGCEILNLAHAVASVAIRRVVVVALLEELHDAVATRSGARSRCASRIVNRHGIGDDATATVFFGCIGCAAVAAIIGRDVRHANQFRDCVVVDVLDNVLQSLTRAEFVSSANFAFEATRHVVFAANARTVVRHAVSVGHAALLLLLEAISKHLTRG